MKKGVIITVLIVVVIISLTGIYFAFFKKGNERVSNVNIEAFKSDYSLNGNGLNNFDLAFLTLEDKKENIIYSPLSIKYALEMLSEGANGDTKGQIDGVIGSYVVKKYNNSKNVSFANALFYKDSFKKNIKKSYIDILTDKYGASVIGDSFETPDKINNWVSDKTLKLIPKLLKDVKNEEYIIINALAIDMEYKNPIQDDNKSYVASYNHEKYYSWVDSFDETGFTKLEFNNKDVNALKVAASINNYDIVNDLGKDNMRNTLKDAYNKWLKENDNMCDRSKEPSAEEYLNKNFDKYIEEINKNYGTSSSSTDFYMYNDDDVKMFAKDLKEYDGLNLEYVGIMPVKDSLDSFIKNVSYKDIDNLIGKLKTIDNKNFEEGYITTITASIPVFKFDYELSLMDDLKSMGIKDAFDPDKADLSNLTSADGTYVKKAVHKATIDFSNKGIKASAATAFGAGYGAAFECDPFTYSFEVKKKEIDLTFDKPYMFLIRDKSSGEVWFTGTVYNPTNYENILSY